VVVVRRTRRHPLYGKVIRVSKRYKAHDEKNECLVAMRLVSWSLDPTARTSMARGGDPAARCTDDASPLKAE